MIDVVTVVGVRAVHFVDHGKGLFCRQALDSIEFESDVQEAVQELVSGLSVYYPEEPMTGEWEQCCIIGDGILHMDASDEGIIHYPMCKVEDIIVEVKNNLWELCDHVQIDRQVVNRQLCLFNIWQAELGI